MNRITLLLAALFIFSFAVAAQDDDSTDFLDKVRTFLGKNQPKLGFMSQFAAELTDDGSNTTSQFGIRKLRVYLTGSAGDNFSYYFQGSVRDTFAFLDLKLMYRLGDHFSIDAGRLKTPFSVEFLRNDTRLTFVGRSAVTMAVGPLRQYGAQLNGSFVEKKIRFTAGIFNGDDLTKKRISLMVGRLLITPILKEENSLGLQIEAGGSMAYSDQYDDLSALPFYGKNHTLFGAYTRVLFREFWLEGEYLNSNSNTLKTREGFYADVGKKFSEDIEIAFRFDWFSRYPLWLSEISRKYVAGINYYPFKSLKLQLDYERDETLKMNSVWLNAQYAVNFE